VVELSEVFAGPERSERGPSIRSSSRPMGGVSLWRENNVEVFLFDTHSGAVELRLRLFGAKEVALRFADDVLLCADDQGRILAQDVVTRKIIRDLRI
jgi:hypothetical protein